MSVRALCYLSLWKRRSRAREIVALLDEDRASGAEAVLAEAAEWGDEELRTGLQKELQSNDDPARQRFGPALANVPPALRRGLRRLSLVQS